MYVANTGGKWAVFTEENDIRISGDFDTYEEARAFLVYLEYNT